MGNRQISLPNRRRGRGLRLPVGRFWLPSGRLRAAGNVISDLMAPIAVACDLTQLTVADGLIRARSSARNTMLTGAVRLTSPRSLRT